MPSMQEAVLLRQPWPGSMVVASSYSLSMVEGNVLGTANMINLFCGPIFFVLFLEK